MTTTENFEAFFEVIKRLRRIPDGCPWDIEQTPLTLRSSFIEEVFEAVDAITENDVPHIKEELGDVLLNALMTAYMFEERKDFTLADVFSEVTEKLIRRHPHVFGEAQADTSGEVLSQWEDIKANVEHRKRASILDEVPPGFPPLLKALKLQKKAAKKGFDWPDAGGAYGKVQEELGEVQDALAQGDASSVEEEVGDVFFALVNWARKLGVDPSVALNRTNEKFTRRFKAVESRAEGTGQEMKKMPLAELDALWDAVKRDEGA